MRLLRSLLALLVLTGCGSFAGMATAEPQNGWWWNPAEEGRGFFIEHRDGFMFVGSYGYDASGRATWFVSGAATPDPNHYSGPLYSMHGGQSLYGAYRAPVGPDASGTLSIDFTDETHGTLRWPGGTVAIERLVFGGESTPDQPTSGWWWNANEDGSGYSVEIQGGMLVIVGFMYDDNGAPTWYLSAGPMGSPTTYRGTLLSYANGQSIGGTYRRPTSAAIGTLDIAFNAFDRATLTFSDSTSAIAKSMTARPQAGLSRLTQVTAMLPTRFVVPDHYVGWFRAETTVQYAALDETVRLVGTIDHMPRVASGSSRFAATAATIVATLTSISPVCRGTGARVFTGRDIVLPNALKLNVNARGDFTFDLDLSLSPIPTVLTCNYPLGEVTFTDDLHHQRNEHVTGAADNIYLSVHDPAAELPPLPQQFLGAVHGFKASATTPVVQRLWFYLKPCFGTGACNP